jgi:NADH-quinone oxidoreductase subunit L
MTQAAWLVPAAPAVFALLALLFGRRLPGGPAALTLLGTLVATVVAVLLLPGAFDHPARTVVHQWAWTPLAGTGPGVAREFADYAPTTGADGLSLHLGTAVNGLSALLAVMVCVVSLLVQLYSTGYLHGDRRLP